MDKQTVEAILDEIDYEFSRSEPPASFPNLPRIPAARYLSEAQYAKELELFKSSWMIAGTTAEFPSVGSYKVMDRWQGASVVIVAGEDSKIRAFWNVCQHRGGPVVEGESGTLSSPNMRCLIHSWVYDLEGKLKGVPGRRDFHNDMDESCMTLKPVRCDVWQGLVWINLDPEAPPLNEWFGNFYDDVTWWEGLRTASHGSLILECNWKVAIEANIEVYHITTVHPNTVAHSLDYRGTVHKLYGNGHSLMVTPNKGYNSEAARQSVNAADDPAHGLMEHANVSYLLFPNHLTPCQKRGGQLSMTLQQFWPLGVDRTLSEWYTMIPDWGDGEPPAETEKRARYYGVIMEEDTEMLDQIQKAMKTQVLEGFLTSYHERRIYHHEASIDSFLGNDVAQQNRIPQLLPVENVE